MRLYKAVRIICEKKHLDAVLSPVFIDREIGNHRLSGLSLLNDEGIPAGCEGDLQSIFTMLIAKVLTNQTGFMANPSFINEEQNELVVGNTVPIATKMTDRFIIRNHFERKQAAIQGILHEGEITVLKWRRMFG